MGQALPKPKKIMPSKPKRDPSEDVPGPLYVQRMLENGPRKGERLSTWLRRLAGIQTGRHFFIKLWRKHEGDRQKIQKLIGLTSAAMSNELSMVGLDHNTAFFMAFSEREHDLTLDVVEEVLKHVKADSDA